RDVEDLPACRPALDPRLSHARVGHLESSCRDMQTPRRGLIENVHSTYSAGDSDSAAAEVGEQLVACLFYRFLIRQRARDVETCLLGIAYDGPCAAIRI